MTDDRRCATCANWRVQSPAAGATLVGECHRYAPRPLVLPGEGARAAQVAWPATRSDETCGEWFYGGDRLLRPVVLTTARAADAAAAGAEGSDDEVVLPAS